MQKIPAADTIAAIDSSEHAVAAKRALKSRASYSPRAEYVSYGPTEQTVAQRLALDSFSELSYAPVKGPDSRWCSDGCTSVERYLLQDGSAGYFKSFSVNSYDESDFEDYGTSTLGAAINEVNAYRMAQLLGGEYCELVPETVLRDIDGIFGTLQREAIVDGRLNRDYSSAPYLRADYRRASLFDFVIANLDRHSSNFLYGVGKLSGRRVARIRLIDNSFSFPAAVVSHQLNESIFADNRAPGGWYDRDGYRIPADELQLTETEKSALRRARTGVEGWLEAKTISRRRGKTTLKRIDFLLQRGALCRFSTYQGDLAR